MVRGARGAAGAEPAAVQRALMLRGDLAAVAEAALAEGAAALDRFRLEVGPPAAPDARAPREAMSTTRLPDSARQRSSGSSTARACRSTATTATCASLRRTLDDVTARVPEIVEAALALPAASAVLDGEVIALRPDGRPRAVPGDRFAVRAGARTRVPLTLFVFDVLHARR